MKLGMLHLRAGATEVTSGQMEAGKPVLAEFAYEFYQE